MSLKSDVVVLYKDFGRKSQIDIGYMKVTFGTREFVKYKNENHRIQR